MYIFYFYFPIAIGYHLALDLPPTWRIEHVLK